MLADTLRNHLSTISYVNDHLIILPDGTQALRPEVTIDSPPQCRMPQCLHTHLHTCTLAQTRTLVCVCVASASVFSVMRGIVTWSDLDPPSADGFACCRMLLKARRIAPPRAQPRLQAVARPLPCAWSCGALRFSVLSMPRSRNAMSLFMRRRILPLHLQARTCTHAQKYKGRA